MLVHCRLGVNRSVTVVAAFLMHRYGFGADEALQLLRERRPCAQPNELYCQQLRVLAQEGLDEMSGLYHIVLGTLEKVYGFLHIAR